MEKAAAELGLHTRTPVSASIIDAHAGGLGELGMDLGGGVTPESLETRLAIVAGTASCYMALSRDGRYIPGCGGRYLFGLVPQLWLKERG